MTDLVYELFPVLREQQKKPRFLDVTKSLLVGNTEQTKTNITGIPSLSSGYGMSVSVNNIDFFEKNTPSFHMLYRFTQPTTPTALFSFERQWSGRLTFEIYHMSE